MLYTYEDYIKFLNSAALFLVRTLFLRHLDFLKDFMLRN